MITGSDQTTVKPREEMVQMADGREVPKYLVDALEKFDQEWPGATFRGARPAIVRTIIEAIKEHAK